MGRESNRLGGGSLPLLLKSLDSCPFSMIKDIGFCRILQDTFPCYMPSARTTLSSTVMPSLYRAATDHVMAQLSHACRRIVHFISNIWISCHIHDSLTVHWWQPSKILGGDRGTSVRRGQGHWAGYCQALLHVEKFSGPHICHREIVGLIGRDLTIDYMDVTYPKYYMSEWEKIPTKNYVRFQDYHINCGISFHGPHSPFQLMRGKVQFICGHAIV